MDIDTRIYRKILGKFATGVTVVTTRLPDGQLWGITVNSFTSVSLEPLLVLWCLGKNSTCFPAFSQCKHYAVNILSAEQQAISDQFAWKNQTDFSQIDTSKLESGSPIIKNSLGALDCTVKERIEGGDHLILIGEVKQIADAEGEPLIYFSGQYRKLQ